MSQQPLLTQVNSITKEEIESMKFMLPPRKLLVQKLTSYIEEDIPAFDVSAAIVGDSIKTSTIFYKKSNNDFNSDTLPIIMCGIPILTVLFEDCFPNLKVNWLVGEGDNLNDESIISNLLKLYGSLKYPTQSQCEKKLKVPIAIVEGPVYQLLQVERLCLNILSHLTGISSISRKVQNLVLSEIEKNGAKFRGEIAATRKTTPGLRHFEKYAVMVGGCKPHRMDLSQMVMLKDNHVDACGGSISKCVKRARSLCGCNTQKIEVECRSLQDAREAAQAGADIVMLDNFNAVQARDASDVLVKEFPNLVIEVSGGLNPETVLEYLKECSNVHVLSMGILTEGGGIKVDFSMKITETTQ